MERSLSVLLPVRNAQSTLAAMVFEVLEVAADLTSRFELVIIDDGSTDATSEIATDLRRRYPQILAIRHGEPQGKEAAIRAGLQCSSGDVVLLRDEENGVGVDGIVRLWNATQQQEVVVDLSRSACERRWARLSGRHEIETSGYQVVDREDYAQQAAPSQPTRPNFMDKATRTHGYK